MKKLLPILLCLILIASASAQNKNRSRRAKPAQSPATKVESPKGQTYEDIMEALGRDTPEWELAVTSASEEEFYYYARRIAHPYPNIVRAWIRTNYANTAIGIHSWMKFVESQNKSPFDFSDYSSTLFLKEFNCATSKFRILKVIYYDAGGKVIAINERGSKWTDSPPDSTVNYLLQAVCEK